MKLAWAFFKRDALIALSYRIAFTAQFAWTIVTMIVLYYVGKTLGPGKVAALEPYGGNFLAFLLIGIALTDAAGISLMGFATQIREAQTTGTLEATLMSPVRLSTILIYSSLWNYFLSTIRFSLYLALGALLYDVDIASGNLPLALLFFALTVLCFMGVGILWAGAVLLIKRGEATIMVMSYMVPIASGAIFPVALLPGWVQSIAALIPLTYALDGMRFALLSGQGLDQLGGTLLTLFLFAAFLLGTGLVWFNVAVDLAKRTGSLTQY